MRKCIGLGIFSLTIIYPLLSPICHLFRNIVLSQFQFMKGKGLIKGFLMLIAEFLVGCIYLFHKCFSKKSYQNQNNKTSIKMDNDFSFLPEDETLKKYPKKLYFYLFILSLIDLLTFTLPTLNSDNLVITDFYYELKYTNILVMSILCKFFLSLKLYKHQFVGTAIMIIGMSINIITLVFLCYDEISVNTYILPILLFFASYILSSIQFVVEKKIFIKYRMSPYEMLLYEGLFGFLSVMILSIYVNYGDANEYNIINDLIDLYQTYKKQLIFFCLLYIIVSFCVNLFAILTIYYFSPTTESVSNSLSSMLFWIVNKFVDKREINNKYTDSFIPFIGYCILCIGSLMYNEIVIFYCFGLEENTKKEVSRRAGKDVYICNTSRNSNNMGYYPLHDKKDEEDDSG